MFANVSIPQVSVQSDSGVDLGVTPLYLYPLKGQPQNPKNLGDGAAHYGGFAVSGEDVQPYQDATGHDLSEFLDGPITLTNFSGNDYEIYAARNIYFATLAVRVGWFKQQQDDGSVRNRSKTHALGLIGKETEDGIVYVDWAVIRSSSYAGKYLKDAIDAFAKSTETARTALSVKHKLDSVLPAGAFWNVLGSGTGEKRETVGLPPSNPKTHITYTQAALPDEWDAEKIMARYIGAEAHVLLANEIPADVLQEWVNEFSKENIAKAEAQAQEPAPVDLVGSIPGFE